MRWEDFSVFDYVKHPVFVLVADSEDRPVYQFVNKAGRERLGKTREEIVGRPVYEVMSGRTAYSMYRRQCAAWAAGEEIEFETTLQLGSDTIWIRTNLVPVHDENGKLTHMVGAAQDITKEREKLYDHVLSAAVAQDMEDMICMAAHDLRSPLCNLKTLAAIMREDFIDHGDGKSELIDMIDAISDKALSVVSGIMGQAMAVGSGGGVAAFDMGEMCDEIMVLLDPTGAHSVSYPRQGVEAEMTVVHIVLRNLIDNALKHSGQSTVKISIELVAMNAERLQFKVRDNGVGFESAALQDQRSAGGPGFGGFGLRGVGRLVRSRGGQLILSKPADGEGAEVFVELPGRLVQSQAMPAPTLRVG
ncbi:PAS domain-containing sensor histidine kinase [uncultured Tateyamaria sp.]|uniref:PAS domain-containing sensor histidine kinase n=1 Tax=uncultured Tateyamaria sp. TaxID=455651 RepID=UPI00260D4C2F|nr:PAS domain-containing sensor histidine kinase [uncultured Tateyamaria sp.]